MSSNAEFERWLVTLQLGWHRDLHECQAAWRRAAQREAQIGRKRMAEPTGVRHSVMPSQ